MLHTYKDRKQKKFNSHNSTQFSFVYLWIKRKREKITMVKNRRMTSGLHKLSLTGDVVITGKKRKHKSYKNRQLIVTQKNAIGRKNKLKILISFTRKLARSVKQESTHTHAHTQKQRASSTLRGRLRIDELAKFFCIFFFGYDGIGKRLYPKPVSATRDCNSKRKRIN